MRSRRKSLATFGISIVILLTVLIWLYSTKYSLPGLLDSSDRSFAYLNETLLNLPPNRWVKLYQPWSDSWRRQAHAGIAFDTKRNKLLIFGSDTHNENWDDSVHEFDPVTEKWSTHYPEAPPETYRADSAGNAVAGSDRLLPWAMHTFDNIIYDPRLDAIVVTALPEHNPIGKKVKGVKKHPTWLYDLATREWRIMANEGKPYPHFFAAASAYDKDRDVIVAYKHGVWELGPDRKVWRQATKERHHEIHYNMEYDSRHHKLVLFGDYRNTNDVWVYTPGAMAGEKGSWEKKVPGGDRCPKDQHFPVAFDGDQGVFLLVPDNRPDSGKGKPASSSTFVYDLEKNVYIKVPGADLEPLGMNYMMVYDPSYKVFLLVTGDWKAPVTVWALRLDMYSL